jgi:beta-galactosidase
MISRRDFLQSVSMAVVGTSVVDPDRLLAVPPAAEPAAKVHFPLRTSSVRPHHGAPALHLNGHAHPALMFFFARAADAQDDVRRFARAGIDLFSGVFSAPTPLPPERPWDLDGVRRAFDAVIRGNPRVVILPRLGLGRFYPGDPEAARFESERQLNRHPVTGELSRGTNFSFSSQVWHERGGEALRTFIRFCEAEYGDHVLGYHLAAGAFGEWSYSWDPALSDASEPQRRAFAGWLQRRYPEQGIDPATVTVPLDRLRAAGQPCLFDPMLEGRTIDYLRFHSEAMAGALVHFCGVAKATLRELNREKICGAFYGYNFKNMNLPANYCNQGHAAQDLLLRSPDVDFVCAPYAYTGRETGHMYQAQLCAGTLRLHGKLYLCEEDTFTFKARREPNRHLCRTREETIDVFRRNLLGILRDGGGAWYMDCGGNGPLSPGGQVDGWYRDDGLMENFAAMQRLAADVLASPDRRTNAQIAIILSDDGVAHLRHDEALPDALLVRQWLEVGRVGASFDCYRAEDIPRLVEQDWAKDYRLILFLSAFALSPEIRAAIDARLKCDGRSLLFVYAPGLITAEGFSTEAMRELTGLQLSLRRASEHLLASCTLTGEVVHYGTERPISPILCGADPAAEVHGTFFNTGDPALLRRNFGSWRSVWSGAPALPAAVLRHLAREAGVHLYSEAGDQVLTLRGLLAVHAGSAGERTIRLPRAASVVNAFSGERVAEATTEIRARFRFGETKVWRLTGASAS